ncbi:hypothetical protein [Enterococcus plantarum]|uniref:hypothetical protein n=1 Tax=Enterococcus plantarum TaxID=1077675 RepID=UPI001A8C1028|nr:hypothetical protein [Enterococcus plantarum]MBO0423840.1 hypothetical protein [Enterococcus plantarum]
MSEHFEFRDDIKCPECGHWFDSDEENEAGLYEYDHLEDAAVFNMTCPSCSKEFEVKTQTYYKFSTIAI